MYSLRNSLLALVAAQLAGSAHALRLPFEARAAKRDSTDHRGKFSATVGNTSIGDFQNVEYISEITVGGSKFVVQLDTGSSDLNIFGSPSTAIDTNLPINVSFAKGADVGVLSFADVEFAGYTVPDQIFNHGKASDATGPDQGLLGLGPTSGSTLSMTAQASLPFVPKSASDSLLDRIFQQNKTTPNYMTFQLGRTDDPNSNSTTLGLGDFTIGEVLPGLGKVWKMPKLDVVPFKISSGQHWAVVLDGFIGANGQPITLPQSVVPGIPSGSMVAIFDTGYTLPQVPRAISDAIYSGIPGASLANVTGYGEIYGVPCNAAVNASFNFQGQDYPIHPLDLNQPSGMTDGNGNPICGGAFQPIQPEAISALDGAADMILGMAFLRNVYVLMNFGDFVDETSDICKPPFVQLLSTTDPATATAEFYSVRNSTPKAGSGSGSGSIVDNLGAITSSSSSSSGSTAGSIVKRFLALIIIVPMVILFAVILGVVCCIRARRARKYRDLRAPAPFSGASGSHYQQEWPGYGSTIEPYQDPFKDTRNPRRSVSEKAI